VIVKGWTFQLGDVYLWQIERFGGEVQQSLQPMLHTL
jgi:hypothetical protein